MYICACVCRCLWRQEEGIRGQEKLVTMNCLLWTLETELRYSARAARVFEQRQLSQVHVGRWGAMHTHKHTHTVVSLLGYLSSRTEQALTRVP